MIQSIIKLSHHVCISQGKRCSTSGSYKSNSNSGTIQRKASPQRRNTQPQFHRAEDEKGAATETRNEGSDNVYPVRMPSVSNGNSESPHANRRRQSCMASTRTNRVAMARLSNHDGNDDDSGRLFPTETIWNTDSQAQDDENNETDILWRGRVHAAEKNTPDDGRSLTVSDMIDRDDDEKRERERSHQCGGLQPSTLSSPRPSPSGRNHRSHCCEDGGIIAPFHYPRFASNEGAVTLHFISLCWSTKSRTSVELYFFFYQTEEHSDHQPRSAQICSDDQISAFGANAAPRQTAKQILPDALPWSAALYLTSFLVALLSVTRALYSSSLHPWLSCRLCRHHGWC